MIKPTRILQSFFLLTCLLLAARAHAQELIFEDEHSILELTLSMNLPEVTSDIGEKRGVHRGFLRYSDERGNEVEIPLKISVRGKYRRRAENCDFPPLELDLPKTKLDHTLFQGQNKLKLVTHCQNDYPEYEQYLLQEYLIYRSYAMLTEQSFRVQLLRITYKDRSASREDMTRYAFLIERDKQVAERNKSEILKEDFVSNERMDKEALSRLYVFEYMIGNIDWSIPMRQNLRLMNGKDPNALVALPYDFDFAEVIGSRYLDKAPKLGQGTMRHQIFADFCMTLPELRSTFDLFRSRKLDIYAMYRSQEGLEKQHAERSIRYYDRFYDILDHPERMQREFVRPCRVKNS